MTPIPSLQRSGSGSPRPRQWARGCRVGQLHVPVTLRNTREVVLAQLGHLTPAQVHTVETEALVDTGAMHLVVPLALAEQLGLVRLRAQAVTMADGRDGVYDQTEPVTVEVLGRSYAL